jgi:Trk K+ transport system NAD-binding subunit
VEDQGKKVLILGAGLCAGPALEFLSRRPIDHVIIARCECPALEFLSRRPIDHVIIARCECPALEFLSRRTIDHVIIARCVSTDEDRPRSSLIASLIASLITPNGLPHRP